MSFGFKVAEVPATKRYHEDMKDNTKMVPFKKLVVDFKTLTLAQPMDKNLTNSRMTYFSKRKS